MSELPMLPMAPVEPEPAAAEPSPDAVRYRVEGMDCGACARTVEKAVTAIDGVASAQVSFGTATMLVTGDVPAERVRTVVRRAGYAAEPVAPRGSRARKPFWRRSTRTLSTVVSAALLALAVAASLAGADRAVAEPLYLLSMAVGGWPIARAALTALRRRTLDMNVLMMLAAVGAVGIGDYAEGAWVLVLFAVGTTLESLALDRSRRSVEALMELAPEQARVLVDGLDVLVAVEQVAPGALVLIRPGERVPLDGVVTDGVSSADESALTGESMPIGKQAGDDVFAGTLNGEGALTVRVSAAASDSTIARVAALVAEAQASRAPAERFVDRFARVYTPLVFVAALLVAVVPVLLGGELDTWLYRSLALLIVACPCALVISVPVAIVSAVGGAARAGVLVKGGEALERLGSVEIAAVDKTGTLTRGTPEVVGERLLVDQGEPALGLAAAVERGSEHPLALAIVEAARARGLQPALPVDFRALPGQGAEATVAGRRLWLGGPRMTRERVVSLPDAVAAFEREAATPVVLGEGDTAIAVFGLADRPRAQAAAAVRALRERARIARIVMLTGDSDGVAHAVAAETGIGEWRAGLLPAEKLEAVKALQAEGSVAMVGDGINDAPALAAADVGIAMGAAGSAVALETADVALMSDDLGALPRAVEHSRRALRIIRQNVAASLAVKAVFVVLAPLGLATLVMAVVADMGMSLLVTLNALRLLRANG